jgi:hypothetical protein
VDKDLQEKNKYNPMQESLPCIMWKKKNWRCSVGPEAMNLLAPQVLNRPSRIENPLQNSIAGKVKNTILGFSKATTSAFKGGYSYVNLQWTVA